MSAVAVGRVLITRKNDARGNFFVSNNRNRFDAVHFGHLYVKNTDVWVEVPSQIDRLLAVLCLAHHFVALALQHLFEVEKDDGIIVCNQNAHENF